MNKNTEEKLHTLRDIHMSQLEKTEIRDTLVHFMDAHPVNRISRFSLFKENKLLVSPYTGISMRLTQVLVFSLVVILGGSGTLAYASQKAIPGQILYPIKIKVTERIEESFISTPSEKIAWKEEKVTRRINEIKKLQEQKEITKKETIIAQTVLKEHVTELKEAFVELKESGDHAIILATSAELLPKTENLLEEVKEVVSSFETTTNIENTETTPETQLLTAIEQPIQVDSDTVSENLENAGEFDTNELKSILAQIIEVEVQSIKETIEETAKDVSPEVPPTEPVLETPVEVIPPTETTPDEKPLEIIPSVEQELPIAKDPKDTTEVQTLPEDTTLVGDTQKIPTDEQSLVIPSPNIEQEILNTREKVPEDIKTFKLFGIFPIKK